MSLRCRESAPLPRPRPQRQREDLLHRPRLLWYRRTVSAREQTLKPGMLPPALPAPRPSQTYRRKMQPPCRGLRITQECNLATKRLGLPRVAPGLRLSNLAATLTASRQYTKVQVKLHSTSSSLRRRRSQIRLKVIQPQELRDCNRHREFHPMRLTETSRPPDLKEVMLPTSGGRRPFREHRQGSVAPAVAPVEEKGCRYRHQSSELGDILLLLRRQVQAQPPRADRNPLARITPHMRMIRSSNKICRFGNSPSMASP
jgi:hypothetical protein